MSWPDDFQRIPDEDWAKQATEALAQKYDTVEEHGWYDNLDFTVSQLDSHLKSDDILLDYSGGTGILSSRLVRAMKERSPHILIADSSPKFLRLSLEKFYTDNRIAFRLIRYLRSQRRLQTLGEVIDDSIWSKGIDGIVSTNAIHLYYGLAETLKSWHGLLKPGGRLHVQSGNINNPDAGGAWIIDETVEHIHRAALNIVASQSGFASLRSAIKDNSYMAAHDKLRQKYFLPVRPLSLYTSAIEQAGFEIEQTTWKSITAQVDEWYDFLAVYHEGVLGWVGGAQKVTGKPASAHDVSLRKALMRLAMEVVFKGRDEFDAAWTYIDAVRK